MGTDFEKKKSHLCGDTVDFTSPPPNLGQDCMQLRVIDMCPFKVLHWLPKKKSANVEKSAKSPSSRLASDNSYKTVAPSQNKETMTSVLAASHILLTTVQTVVPLVGANSITL